MIGRENTPKQDLEQLAQSVKDLEIALAELRESRGAPQTELEERQRDLERQLEEERAAHAADRAALEELRSRMALEDQTMAEMRDALRKKLEELNERDRRDEFDRQDARRAFQAEMEEKRALLDQELEQFRQREMANLRQQVQDFWGCYSAYLSQIQQAVEQLNKTALAVGQTTFDGNTDVVALFQGLMGPFPFGKTAPEEEGAGPQEAAAPETTPAEWYAPAPSATSSKSAEKELSSESAESSEQAESPKTETDTEDDKDFPFKPVPLGTIRPFIVREDVPANTTK